MFIPRLPYEPNASLVARKAFEVGGVKFKPGDPFDPRKVGVDERRVRQMWGAFQVDVSKAAAAPKTDAPSSKKRDRRGG